MKRADFRRLERMKKQGESRYTFTRSQLELLIKQAQADVIPKALRYMVSLSAIVLRDAFGFGKVRLDRFMVEFVKKYLILHEDLDKITSDTYDFDTFRKVILDETGYDIMDRFKDSNML